MPVQLRSWHDQCRAPGRMQLRYLTTRTPVDTLRPLAWGPTFVVLLQCI